MRLALALAVAALAGCPYDAADVGGGGDAPPGTPDAPPGTPDAPPDLPDAPPGTPDADDDTDDDGVPNAIDNCPTIGNPLQRDHDADTRGDDCDRCPHLADPADPDGDADGVGDACDPTPGEADAFVAFYGFYDAAEVDGWGPNTGWAVAGGVVARTAAAGTSQFGPAGSVHNPFVMSRAEVTSIAATSSYSVGLSVAVNPSPQHYYSCYRNRGTSAGNPYVIDAFLAAWPGDTDYIFQTAPSLVVGTELDLVDAVDPDGSHCVVNSWTYDQTDHGPTDGTVVFWTDDLIAAYDYLFIVSSAD